MGVIYKVLHRSEKLKKAPFRNLFLDMEENIHIHYRDLRIELSRAEFEEIVNTFTKQSAELMKIIKDTNYKDGVLPNANFEDTRIWTESRLETPVVYHPQRISLEECSDGFHLHVRNYKFLFSHEDFRVLVDAFKEVDLESSYATTIEEIDQLLEANHLHYIMRRTTGRVKAVTVANYHEVKIRSILLGIGMTRKAGGGIVTYTKGDLKINVDVSKERSDFAQHFAGLERPYRSLAEVLSDKRGKVDVNWLNSIKARVLNTFWYWKKTDQPQTMNLDYRSWLYDDLYDKIIYPFDPSPKQMDPRQANRSWNTFLKTLDMYFVKPKKIPFQRPKQMALYDATMDKIMETVDAVPAISKVYLMGSTIRKSMGFYRFPFIHSEWAKLASDVDILIEVDEALGFEPPESWDYINISTGNQCDIYHIGEIPFDDVMAHRKAYPNLDYFDHLLDAYIYKESTSDAEKKDAFLAKHKAVVVFDRERDKNYRATLEALFGGPVSSPKRLNVATENELYSVNVAGKDCLLKIYKVSGNYSSEKLAEHVVYESKVVKAIAARGVPIAAIYENNQGTGAFDINGGFAALIEKLDGTEVEAPDYPVVETANVLAQFHAVQIDKPLDIETEFSFDSTFDIWHSEFHRFAGEVTADEDLTALFKRLEGTYNDLRKTYKRLVGLKSLVNLHNHGDIQPRNVIMKDGKAQLFDFQNAFFGPRLIDVVEGAIEFSWGFKNPDHNDFSRYDQFIAAYDAALKVSPAEKKCLDDVLRIVGLIKFLKEVRMMKGSTNPNHLRRRRAVDLANFMIERLKL